MVCATMYSGYVLPPHPPHQRRTGRETSQYLKLYFTYRGVSSVGHGCRCLRNYSAQFGFGIMTGLWHLLMGIISPRPEFWSITVIGGDKQWAIMIVRRWGGGGNIRMSGDNKSLSLYAGLRRYQQVCMQEFLTAGCPSLLIKYPPG